MIHILFDRPTQALKVFGADKALWNQFDASGDAWGDGMSAPYGFDYPIPPGHYMLMCSQSISPPLASEGAAQVPVVDIDLLTATELIAAGDAVLTSTALAIGTASLPTGGLQSCKRSGIMIHGGGSNLTKMSPPEDPFAPKQRLCKTHGCTRMHNADLGNLIAYLTPLFSANHVVFSVLGDPAPLPF